MPLQVAPTKSNLQKAKRALVVAKNGYGLLDRKRAVLLRELMAVLDEARKAQTEANDNLAKAFGSLQAANIRLGADAVEEIAAGCEEAPELRILAKSVMGAWIPAVTMPPAARPTYSFTTTGAALDEAVLRFRTAAALTARSAALENSVIVLAQEIQSTQKRANALHNVLIPRYEEQVKFITESLEEREREDFFKVKQVKDKKVRNAAQTTGGARG